MKKTATQYQRFKEVAEMLGCNESESTFKSNLGKIAKPAANSTAAAVAKKK